MTKPETARNRDRKRPKVPVKYARGTCGTGHPEIDRKTLECSFRFAPPSVRLAPGDPDPPPPNWSNIGASPIPPRTNVALGSVDWAYSFFLALLTYPRFCSTHSAALSLCSLLICAATTPSAPISTAKSSV